MNKLRLILILCGCLILSSVSSPARAATMNPGDFSVSMAKPEMTSTQTMTCSYGGVTKTIDPSNTTQSMELGTLFGALRTSAVGNTMDCVVNGDQIQTGVDLSGTVTNSALGLSGTMEQTCDLNHETDTSMKFQNGVAQIDVVDSGFVIDMYGFQSCSWAMAFADGSKLAGTIKQVINIDPTGGTVSAADSTGVKTYSNSVTMSADVLITGGSGVFASMAGTANFSNVSPVVIRIPNPNPSPSMFLRNVLGTTNIKFADAPSGMSGMALDNSNGGSVDFAIPAQSSAGGYTFGKGADGKEQEIRLTTAPNAKCTITVTGNGKKKATLVKSKKTKSGEYQTTISASDVAKKLKTTEAKLKGKTGTMTASCTAGKKGKAVKKKITFTFADV